MLLNTPGKDRASIIGADGFNVIVKDPDAPGNLIKAQDFISGMWHVGLGHGVFGPDGDLAAPTIKYTNDERDELAEELERLFGYSGTFLFQAGSQVTDTAVQLAIILTGRDKFLSLEEGYHGCTGFGALVGRDLNRKGMTKRLQDSFDGGTIGRWAFEETVDQEQMEKELDAIAWSELAGFIFEPVQGSAAGYKLNQRVYEEIGTRCRANGVFIIADEIMTGIVRCGELALTTCYIPSPDMLALGKGLGNGHAISALLCSEEITARRHYFWKRGYFGTTHAGNIAGCRAASRVLKTVSQTGFQEEVRRKAALLKEDFDRLFSDCPGVVGHRSHGLFFGLNLRTEDLAVKVHHAVLCQGHSCIDQSGGKIRFVPPLPMPIESIRPGFVATARRIREFATEK